MKNNKIIFSVLLITGIILYSFVPNEEEDLGFLKYELAFSINPSSGTGIVNYVILGVDKKSGKIVNKKSITEGQFVMYGKGILKTKANPKRIDFYKKYMVDCGIIMSYVKSKRVNKETVYYQDTLWEEMKPVCLPIYDIWKIRYSVHPKYGTGKFVKGETFPPEDIGWSANRHFPSEVQIKFLQKYYGISTIQGYFRGEKMFILFRDMQNEDWVTRYSELS